MSPYAHITGWGMSVPERVLTNDEISYMVDTSDEWIQERTGIRERRIAGSEESTSTLAVDAALKALEMANLKPADLDLIIVSTSTPEYIFPSTACLVQDRIGAVRAGAYDLLAACTGFIYALSSAAQNIRSGDAKSVLVIGAETLSRFTNWEDRGTCILFGDGAGAFILQASETPGGYLGSVLRADGSGSELLLLKGGGSAMPASQETVKNGLHYIQMKGREVFRFATRVLAQSTEQVVQKAGLVMDDINLLIPHQANRRIIDAALKALNVPLERCVINIERYGNTSTASIPIATCEAVNDGKLQAGDRVVFVGFGAGLTWGSALFQWSGPILPKRKVYPWSYRMWARVRSFLRRAVRRIEGLLWGKDYPEI